MALKPCERQAEPHPSSLAVPFPGAMALKRRRKALLLNIAITCSPLPRGDGAETISLVYVTLDLHYLAVPFPGAMALKPCDQLEDHQRLRPCSPLPRGDGAETD